MFSIKDHIKSIKTFFNPEWRVSGLGKPAAKTLRDLLGAFMFDGGGQGMPAMKTLFNEECITMNVEMLLLRRILELTLKSMLNNKETFCI